MLQMATFWIPTCFYHCVQTLLTSLASLPETLGLFLVGIVLMLSGVILRRVFLLFEGAIPTPRQNAESKEHPLK
jgi:hypothetical protein